MSKKTTTKTKGHRFEKVRYHIPFYTSEFFDPKVKFEDGGGSSKSNSTVSIPVKISADGSLNRSNLTNFAVKSIQHFDNNVENVLKSVLSLNERIIKPRAIEDGNKKIKTTIHLMHLICMGPARTTLEEATRMARKQIYDEYLVNRNGNGADAVQEDVLVADENTFYEFLDRTHENLTTTTDYRTSAEFTTFLYKRFYQLFWNQLHSVIFGADAY